MASDAAAPLCYLARSLTPEQALAVLAEPIATWFRQAYAAPTLSQRFAWPALGRGDNLLLCAPTGTGKTLAAFLPILSRLWDEPEDGLACLYIAPMKALGRDVGKNLLKCLRGIEEFHLANAGRAGCASLLRKRRVRIGLRTGDTTSKVRKQQLASPPRLLLTTPESLAVLLTNSAARDLLGGLRWVVLDEIHALAGNKRGADLSLSLERLEALQSRGEQAGSFQRIGLSATCAPVQTAARFLVGMGRPCTIAQVPEQASMNLAIEPLPADDAGPGFMARLVERLQAEIPENRTTLIFTNARGLAERLTWALKRRFPDRKHAIAVHHSSLAVQRRRAVERRLKLGRLDIVVSSTSLELGIDIGGVDGVVFVHPARGVARFLQRLGRSGHRPGQPRRGLVLTSGPAELLEAAMTAAAGRAGQVEPLVPPAHPLDVLCQHLAGMAMAGWWTRDDALRLVRRAFPFRDLSERDFDHALAYLSGHDADGRSWLTPRLRWDADRFGIAHPATTALLRRNLGTILNEQPRAVRLLLPPSDDSQPGKSRSIAIGSLDDAYADRLRPGDRLLLDGRCFEYRRRERGCVLVDEVSSRPVVPRWAGSGWPLSRELAQQLYLFRLQAADALREGPAYLRLWLAREYHLGEAASAELARYFVLQDTVSEIPDACTLLVETVADGQGRAYYFHTPLHRPANDALARLASWRLFRAHGLASTTVAADLGFFLALPTEQIIDAQAWRSLFAIEEFDNDLREALEDSAALRERFGQVATTGLMILRNPVGGRRKVGGRDWAERRLFDQIRDHDPDFLLLREAEREIMAELCNAPAAHSYLAELPKRHVRCRHLAQVSPFAASWTQVEGIADASITEPEEALARLHQELMVPCV